MVKPQVKSRRAALYKMCGGRGGYRGEQQSMEAKGQYRHQNKYEDAGLK